MPCTSGEVRTRLKDPSKAFQFFHPEWSVRINGLIEYLNNINSNVTADIQKKLTPIVQGLNSMNGKAQQDYNAVYMIYHSNVCNDDVIRWWMQMTEKIMEKGDMLSIIETQLKVASGTPETLVKALENVDAQIRQWLHEPKFARPEMQPY